MGEDFNHQASQGCRFPDWPVKLQVVLADKAVRTSGDLGNTPQTFYNREGDKV
jgi:hypothetical protein